MVQAANEARNEVATGPGGSWNRIACAGRIDDAPLLPLSPSHTID
jgi:hypothetical protein